MPNHVHMVLLMLGENKLADSIREIKHCSAYSINKVLGTRGPVWMRNYFDRIIRSEDGLKHAVNYIRSNPRHLPPTDYSLYLCPTRLDPYGNWLG